MKTFSNQDELAPIPFVWPIEIEQPNDPLMLDNSKSPLPLKPEEKHGVFQWWVERLPPWVHPDDLSIANQLVPGNRVFRKVECENFADRKLGYSDFVYGQQRMRALPGLWLEIQVDGYEVGDLVEIKSQYGKLRPRIASIGEIEWNRNTQEIEYRLIASDHKINYAYASSDIQPVFRLGGHLTPRELEISERLRFS